VGGVLTLLAACGLPTSMDADELTEQPEQAATSSSTPSATTPPATGPWIVSLGDSFISGEAGRWAGNSYGSYLLIDALGPTAYFDSPDGQSELIPLCHRSKSAMVHIGDDGTPSSPGNPVGSMNLACSGAETETMTESNGAFKPGLDFVGAGTAQQGQAAMLQDFANQRNVQMVLVSIGGNDFGFADVIADCAEDYVEDANYCSEDPTDTNKIAPGRVTTITNNITAALQNVQKAMRQAGRQDGSWTLVVNLNPDTLPLAGDFRYQETYSRWTDGGCPFYDQDAQWAGTAFIGTVRSAAQNALQAANITPSVLLDLSNLLDERELCAKGTLQVGAQGAAKNWQTPGAVDDSEWSNEARREDSNPYFEQESLHPNYWAQLAARSCVRQLYVLKTRVDSTCTRSDDGLTSRGEPVVTLAPRSGT
jgi:hypothetical protein